MTLRSQIIGGLLLIQAIVFGILIRFLIGASEVPLGDSALHPEVSTTKAGFAIAVAVLASILLSGAFLAFILRPLQAIQSAAKAFSEQRFKTIPQHPWGGELRQLVTCMNDASRRVSEMQESESRQMDIFRREAFGDATTGLENRRSFDLRFRNLLNAGGDAYEQLQLVVLEIDGLKNYNVQHGYQAGNSVLTRIANAAVQQLGASSTICARIGGSAFGFICQNSSEQDVTHQLERLLANLSGEQALPAELQLNIGLTSFSPGEAPGTVLTRADVAVERSRQSRSQRIKIAATPEAPQPSGSQDWRRVIEEALDRQQWSLMVQPVYSFDGEIMHHEIMGRLSDARGNLLKASQFIPMAQRHNLAAAVDRAIVTQAIHFVTQVITERKNDGIPASVNISFQSISDPTFITWLDQQLIGMGEKVSLLSFEISEIGLRHVDEAVLGFKQLVKKFGLALGIDHFGLAPQSATLLRQVMPDYIKIDSGLVREISENSDARHILASLVQLAHSLDVRVIAQNIENDKVIPILKEEKVDGGQGYYFGRPGPMLKAA